MQLTPLCISTILSPRQNLCWQTMATALNLLQTPILRTFPFRRTPKSTVSVSATSSSSETPITSTSVSTKEEQTQGLSSSVTFAPPPDFKPPEPKRFGVRPDKTWDVLGASLALFFRLGTGVFVSGYGVFLLFVLFWMSWCCSVTEKNDGKQDELLV